MNSDILDDNLNKTIFKHNIINAYRAGGPLLVAFWPREYFEISNNLIYTKSLGIVYFHKCDSIYIHQNTFIPSRDLSIGDIYIYRSEVTEITNNIFHSTAGIYKDNDDSSPYLAYNLFYNTYGSITTGPVEIGPGNLIEQDPMFVNDSFYHNLNWDAHLQHGSPAIDAGDPNVLDVNGSRSDIGFYGGPSGESYKYPDLPPKPVVPDTIVFNLSEAKVKLAWQKNIESDLAGYNIHRGLTEDFIPKNYNKIAFTDTSYFEYILADSENKSFYYKVKAVDQTGNLSPVESCFYLQINVLPFTGLDRIDREYDYKLNQNFPNPFNPSTVISYSLKDEGFVRLKVYDTNGQFVETVESSLKSKGNHEVEFDGSNLASGIYIYRIEVLNNNKVPVFLDMGKMVLVK